MNFPSRSKSLSQKKSSGKKEDPKTSVVPFLILFGTGSCVFDDLESWGHDPGSAMEGWELLFFLCYWIIDAFLFSCKWTSKISPPWTCFHQMGPLVLGTLKAWTTFSGSGSPSPSLSQIVFPTSLSFVQDEPRPTVWGVGTHLSSSELWRITVEIL